MKRWKFSNKILVMLCAISLFLGQVGLAIASVAAQPAVSSFETTAEAAVLMEPTTGTIIFEKNAHKSLPPASVTKIMTLLVAVEAIEQGKCSLKDRVKATEEAAGLGGSQIYLEVGEEFSLEELLISVAVGSANDASVAVAEHIAGSHDEFVSLMNTKAHSLGLKDSKFINSYGLPAEGHVTSAYDMAVILREGMKYPLFRRITSLKEYNLRGGEFKLYNTNKLLWWYQGVDTGKTGWTNEAKYCLASSAERDGLRLIAVVLGSPEKRSHFRESIRLYNYGFAKYRGVTVAEPGAQIRILPVEKGTVDQVQIVAKSRIGIMVPKGKEKELSHRIVLPTSVQAPIFKGQKVGVAIISQNGKDVASFELIAGGSVTKAGLWQQIRNSFEQVYSNI